MRYRLSFAMLVLLCVVPLRLAKADGAAAGEIPLIDKDQPAKGWSFGDGPEFPGATGGLTAEPRAGHDGGPADRAQGRFQQGGQLRPGRPGRLTRSYPRSLTLWVKARRFGSIVAASD